MGCSCRTLAIADEIQQPFGTDVNDIDLDAAVRSIVNSILFEHQCARIGQMAVPTDAQPVPRAWVADSGGSSITLDEGQASTSIVKPETLLFVSEDGTNKYELAANAHAAQKRNAVLTKVKEFLKLAANAAPLWMMTIIALWTGLATVISWLTRYDDGKEFCDSLWWCSPISIGGSVSGYVGFALFFLLGFRLYDSHGRFADGVRIWSEQIIGNCRIFSNRVFQSHPAGLWHPGDLERFAGHLAAHGVACVSKLREEDCEDQLSELLNPTDVRHILESKERADYCLNVVRSYLVKADHLKAKGQYPGGGNELWNVSYYLMQIRRAVADCERMIRVPLPFGYVQHVRLFLWIWVGLLPLGLVEAQGPATIIWVLFISYGVIGLETWASELSNPFGHDLSDVPLDDLTKKLTDVIRTNLFQFSEGTHAVIKANRGGFPDVNVMREQRP